MKEEIQIWIGIFQYLTKSAFLLLSFINVFIIIYQLLSLLNYYHYYFETRFLCVILLILELTLYTRLSWNSEVCQVLLPSARIKDVLHYTWPFA